MDVVYILKPRDDHSELRYSLRSLSHIPYRRVWFAGHMPSWVRNAGRIETPEGGDRWTNQRTAIYAAATHPEVADRFVLMNDDFFFLRPLRTIPVVDVGPIDRGRYNGLTDSMSPIAQLYRLLRDQGVSEPLEYAEHAPMVMGKRYMASAHEICRHIHRYQVPTAYGNYAAVASQRGEDIVIGQHRPRWPEAAWYASVGEEAFYEWEAGARVREMFQGASWHEPQLADDFCLL